MNARYLAELVQDYLTHSLLAHNLAFYNTLSFDKAIEHAGLAKRQDGKRESHQRRLKRQVLNTVKEHMEANKQCLEQSTSFEDIMAFVRDCTVPGFGELAIYDASLRLGAHLNKWPQHAYLHAGTRKGAAALGLKVDREYLEVNELPKQLQKLQAHQIEDFLCIYKDCFSQGKLADDSRSSCNTSLECVPSSGCTSRLEKHGKEKIKPPVC